MKPETKKNVLKFYETIKGTDSKEGSELNVMDVRIENGRKVKCLITGFTGIVTGRCEYLHGNTRCYVSPRIGIDNEMKKGQWFNEGQLEEVK